MFKHTQSCNLCSNTPSHAYISLKVIVIDYDWLWLIVIGCDGPTFFIDLLVSKIA